MEKSNHEFDFLFLCKSNVMQGNTFFVRKKFLPIFTPPFLKLKNLNFKNDPCFVYDIKK